MLSIYYIIEGNSLKNEQKGFKKNCLLIGFSLLFLEGNGYTFKGKIS